MWANLVQDKGIVFNFISHQAQLGDHRKLMNPKALQVAFLKFADIRICQDIFDCI